MDAAELKDFMSWIIGTYGWHCLWIIPSGLLIYGIIFPEKLEKWSSWFYKFFSWVGATFQRRFIASDIQARINASVKIINSELKNAAPYGIKIRWISGEEMDREGFIRGDNVVIMMKRHTNQDQNLVLASLVYSSVGVLAESRNYMLPRISRSLDLSLTKKILILGNKHSALDLFIKTILKPEKDKDRDVKIYCDIMESLDEFGILVRIFMTELLSLSRQLYPKLLGDESILVETGQFLSFCEKIALRRIGEEVELDFNENRISIGVVLVAKTSKREFLGVRPYIWRFKKCAGNDSDFVYFYGWNRMNITFVKEIVKRIEKLGLGAKISESIFSAFIGGKRAKAICVRIKVLREPRAQLEEAGFEGKNPSP